MRPSTVIELAGFALIIGAAWEINAILGAFLAGLVLLLIGYAFDDSLAISSFRRATAPLARKRAEQKARRAVRRATRKAER